MRKWSRIYLKKIGWERKRERTKERAKWKIELLTRTSSQKKTKRGRQFHCLIMYNDSHGNLSLMHSVTRWPNTFWYLAIHNNENLPNGMWNSQKLGGNFAKYYKTIKNYPRLLILCQSGGISPNLVLLLMPRGFRLPSLFLFIFVHCKHWRLQQDSNIEYFSKISTVKEGI